MEYTVSDLEGYPHALLPDLNSNLVASTLGYCEDRHLLKHEVSQWLNAEMKGRARTGTISTRYRSKGIEKKVMRTIIYFTNMDDLLQFKLIWCGR